MGEGSPTKVDYREKLVPLFQPLKSGGPSRGPLFFFVLFGWLQREKRRPSAQARGALAENGATPVAPSSPSPEQLRSTSQLTGAWTPSFSPEQMAKELSRRQIHMERNTYSIQCVGVSPKGKGLWQPETGQAALLSLYVAWGQPLQYQVSIMNTLKHC